jgi:hypothetical protein
MRWAETQKKLLATNQSFSQSKEVIFFLFATMKQKRDLRSI